MVGSTDALFNFILERHAIYERRRTGMGRPWTQDPILQAFRFCNVFRELDTETIWFAQNWRKEYADDPDLWFASLVFRLINWHETAEELHGALPWGRWARKAFIEILNARGAAGKKVYNSAYMISTHGVKQKKSVYLANSLDKIWSAREKLRYLPWEGLSAFHARLMSQFDLGSFLAAQVVADCKYAGQMQMATDWWTFAASGPGSRRGLSRVLGKDVKTTWGESAWRAEFSAVYPDMFQRLMNSGALPMRMHAQDLQNCLCEFDKYERVRLGQGQPKARYNGLPTIGGVKCQAQK